MIGAPLPAAEYDAALSMVLQRRRKDLGLSKTQLAIAAGISPQQIQRYELGANKVSVSRLMQLAHSLGIPASEIIAEIEIVPTRAKEAADLDDLAASKAGRDVIAAARALLGDPHLGLLAELAKVLAEKPMSKDVD